MAVALGVSAACSDDEPLGTADASATGGVGGDASVDAGAGGVAGNPSAGAGGLDAADDSGPASISASSATLFETETWLAAAPNGTLGVSFIAVTPGGKTENGVVVSTNDGASWQAPVILSSPEGRSSADPVVFADPSSRLFLSWLGFRRDSGGSPYDMRVYLARTAPGATALGAPQDLSGPVAGDSLDKPWGVAAPDGTVYVTWFDSGAERMRVAVSNDSGQSFTTHTILDQPGFRNLIFPCVDDVTGRVHVVFHTGVGVGLRFSDDQGATWPGGSDVSVLGDEPASFDDPTCVAHDGAVWVAYGIGTEASSSTDSPRSNRIRVAHSSDGGVTFTERAFAEDPTSGTKFLHPALARGADGRLGLLYYAGSEQNPDPKGSVQLASSVDGKLWSSALVKSPITFRTYRVDPAWLGDYVGLTTRGATRLGVYADNASGKSHVQFFQSP